MKVYGRSDVGRVRPVNEDSYGEQREVGRQGAVSRGGLRGRDARYREGADTRIVPLFQEFSFDL